MANSQSWLCPSAQPGMRRLRLIGVVERTDAGSRVAYLNEDVPVTPDLLEQTSPVAPTEVFRLGGDCEETRCRHFDGAKCQLVLRIVNILPPVVDELPRCLIRATCRWFAEEGQPACLRCPQVVTESVDASEDYRRAATPAQADA